MGRLGGVGSNAYLGRVRQQAFVDQAGIFQFGNALLIVRVLQCIFFTAVTCLEAFGRCHRRTPTVGRGESGKGKPGFIPEEDQVRFYRQAFLHHAFDIVDNAVKGAVGQQQHLHLVQQPGLFVEQQCLLDLLERHRAIHRVVVQRVGIQVTDMRARKHHAVVVRFMAIAIDQDDIARPDQCLHHDLVRGRCPIGDKVSAFSAKRACRQLLGFLDWPMRLQQRIEPTRCRRGFRKKNIHAVKLHHILDPVRFGHRFAARNRHRVKYAGWLAAVFAQRGKKGRLVTLLDAAQDIQVQVEVIFLLVKNTLELLRHVTGDILDRGIGNQV